MLQDFMDKFLGNSENKDVDTLIRKCGYASAALTIIPIPGSEIIAVMPIHVGMVMGIAQAYDVEITKESAMELVLQITATVGLSLVGSRIATTASKIILPGLGGLISAPLIFASTIALGSVAKAYFELEGDIDEGTMKHMYKDMLKKAKNTFDASEMKDEEIKDMAKTASEGSDEFDKKAEEIVEETPTERLKKLKELLDLELISQEEYDATKEKVLSEI